MNGDQKLLAVFWVCVAAVLCTVVGCLLTYNLALIEAQAPARAAAAEAKVEYLKGITGGCRCLGTQEPVTP